MNPMNARPDFQGGNRVQYMGNREAMDRKSEALKKFSGTATDFPNWSNRFMDHMGRVHADWKNTLQWLSETNEQLSYARLASEVLGPFNERADLLARQLEQTIIDYMPERIYNRRTQLCGGPLQKENGFILWRNLFREYVGERQVLEDAGVECLRTYGQCASLQDLPAHIDGWYELLDGHCPEMRECPRMLRSLFLGIIPKELKSKILEEPGLQSADHRHLAEWCKGRASILQREHHQSVAKKNMARTYGGSVKTLLPGEDGYMPEESISESTPPPPPWLKSFGDTIIAAIKPPAPKKSDRGRTDKKNEKGQRSSSRSTSRGRRFLEGWGRRCNHCGSKDHMKKDCKEFAEMMKKANVGRPKDQWKPPEGYKSALGKARDLARAAEKKNKKVAALETGSDTASDDDCDFGSEHGGSFRVVAALTRVKPLPSKICHINKFSGLDMQQDYDPDVLKSLNAWAHNVKVAPKKARKAAQSSSKLDRTVNYINGGKKCGPEPRSQEDIVVGQMAAAAPSSKINAARAARTIGNWELEDGEILAIFDTGSFTHAIDADVELPDHEVQECDADSPGTSAETAGGDVIRKLGTVHTESIIDDSKVGIIWDHMKVSTPILSVRKLVRDGNDVHINRHGGTITNLKTGKTMKVHNFQGIYYLRMKITSGTSSPDRHPTGFHRPGP